MKTYTGELKKDMPCRYMVRSYEGMDVGYKYYAHGDAEYPNPPEEVHVDNEWQRYEPKPKKVWGIPEKPSEYYSIVDNGWRYYTVETNHYKDGDLMSDKPVYLCKQTAEQRAKAENYINEFRALSDVPADGLEQWYIDKTDHSLESANENYFKLRYALFGVVVDNGRKDELHQWLKPMRIADKIVTWGFHGIVEDVL